MIKKILNCNLCQFIILELPKDVGNFDDYLALPLEEGKFTISNVQIYVNKCLFH